MNTRPILHTQRVWVPDNASRFRDDTLWGRERSFKHYLLFIARYLATLSTLR